MAVVRDERVSHEGRLLLRAGGMDGQSVAGST